MGLEKTRKLTKEEPTWSIIEKQIRR